MFCDILTDTDHGILCISSICIIVLVKAHVDVVPTAMVLLSMVTASTLAIIIVQLLLRMATFTHFESFPPLVTYTITGRHPMPFT